MSGAAFAIAVWILVLAIVCLMRRAALRTPPALPPPRPRPVFSPSPIEKDKEDEEDEEDIIQCGGDGANLDPIMDPAYNMEQIAKQCVLLEEHLHCPNKRCKDCIKKHFLHISGLAEEAVSLCLEDDQFIQSVPPICNSIFAEWKAGTKSPEECSREIRQLRKSIMTTYI